MPSANEIFASPTDSYEPKPELAAQFSLANIPQGFIETPYPWYASLQEYEPVKKQADGSFIVSRYSDLDMIYRDTTRFSSDKKKVFLPKFGKTPLYEHHTTSLVFNDPPLHTRVRSIMVGAMNPRAIANMEPGLNDLVDRLLDDMAQTDKVDLIADFASAIPIEVIGNLLGVPHTDRGPLRGWSLSILGALEPSLTDEELQSGNQAVSDFLEYLKDLTRDRRANPLDPETDVLTRLIQTGDEPLSEIELMQNCIFILNAGHETTTNLIGNGIALLSKFPKQKQLLFENSGIITTAIDEFLRLESPNQLGNRLTTQNVTIGDVEIPEGTDLHLVIGAANRDPAKFDNPHEMDITRRPNKHLAFAGGAHTCVGLSLARMEGRIGIRKFLQRYPNHQLSEGARVSSRIRFRGFERLPAILG